MWSTVTSEESSEEPFCNIYKVSQHGRSAAIAQLQRVLRGFSISENQCGRFLDADCCVTCTRVQDCHADVLINRI